MAENFCLEWDHFETGPDEYERFCISYLNDFEMRKHLFASDMSKRQDYWIYSTMVMGPIIFLFLFVWLPQWMGEAKRGKGDIVTSILLGFVASAVAPLLFQIVFSPPVEWFPDWIVEFNQGQVQKTLEMLR